MKLKLIVAGLMVVAALSLVACAEELAGPGEPGEPVETGEHHYTCNDFMQQNHVVEEANIATGESLTVTLGSNPTTGFQWSEEASIGDPTVLKQVTHEYIEPDSELVGAAGKEKWTFEALKPGATTVSLEYSRPWEGGEKSEWTYTLMLIVK